MRRHKHLKRLERLRDAVLDYYNELWKKINEKDHEPFPEDGVVPRSHVSYKDMKFTDTMKRAEWLAKQPLPSYMWTEAK